MSEIKVSSITDRAGTGKPNFSVHPTIDGGLDPNSPPTRNEGSTRPSSPREGDTWWDTANSNYEVYIDGAWEVMLGTGYTPKLWFGDRATHHGDDTFQYYNITTTGNATAWGNTFTFDKQNSCAASDHTYALVAGGDNLNTVQERYTFATAGSAISGWTDLLERSRYSAAASNTQVMHVAGGQRTSHPDSSSDFYSFTTSGNATLGGNISSRTKLCAFSDGTKGYYLAGQTSSASGYSNQMQYLNIGTTDVAYDFGDLLTSSGGFRTAASNTWRGLVFGGFSPAQNRICYLNLGAGGNATDFGDTLSTIYGASAAANSTRCCIAGGYTNTTTNVIQYVTIDTKGNAADFGDLATADRYMSGASGAAS